MDGTTRPNRQRHRRPTGVLGGLALAAVLVTGCSSGATKTESGDTATTVAVRTSTTGSTTTMPTTTSSTTTSSTTTSTSTTSTTSTTTTTPTTTTSTPPNSAITEPAGSLKSGDKGTRSLAVQQALKDQHYDPGAVDGAFGLRTTQAVWAFQALHGLATDGVVGPETEAVILARTPQPMLKPELGPTHTEVDLTRQVLIVFRDGAPTLITHVSSGSGVAYCENTDKGKNCGDAQTPTGVFTFERKIQGIREAPLGKLYDPIYFKGGYAVHGSPSVPNRAASHGCVRIPMGISDYFQTVVNLGEKIEVFRS